MRIFERGIVAFAVIAALAVASGPARAQPVTNDAYARDMDGNVEKNPFGLCWRTYSWTPQKAIPECDPQLFPKAEAKPAPVPVPVPVARVIDSDGDGVPDDMDQCPNTPPGAKVDARGCELDSDGDGVVDRLDQCPDTPRGAKVDERGCELDSDGDGVVDRLDKCPGTRPGAKVDADGCEIQEVLVLKGVTFATNSAQLTPQSNAILDEAAATLIKRGNVKTEVAGHTDNRGSAARNRVLSQQRAESVMRYLVSKGVNASSLTAKGYGQDNPIADNRTEAGRATNRRVELRPTQ